MVAVFHTHDRRKCPGCTADAEALEREVFARCAAENKYAGLLRAYNELRVRMAEEGYRTDVLVSMGVK